MTSSLIEKNGRFSTLFEIFMLFTLSENMKFVPEILLLQKKKKNDHGHEHD